MEVGDDDNDDFEPAVRKSVAKCSCNNKLEGIGEMLGDLNKKVD